jgi:CRP/FNR family transcriptional regulator
MVNESGKSNCTNGKWLGRADCVQCHIRRLMLFSGLPDSAFDNRLQPIDHFIFPPGSTLYETGDNDGFIYSIRNGLVKLLHFAPDGNRRIVRMLGRGASVGLELLDGPDGYRHTAMAVNEVDACRIPLSTVINLQTEYPELCDQIHRHLQNHLDRADEWIVALSAGPARDRVIHLLLMFDELGGNTRDGVKLLGREDMADIVGVSVETVSRIVADLKRNHLLYTVSDNLYRCDRQALQSILHSRIDSD